MHRTLLLCCLAAAVAAGGRGASASSWSSGSRLDSTLGGAPAIPQGRLGGATRVSGDGRFVLAGAPYAKNTGGSVVVFERSSDLHNATWARHAVLVPDDTSAGDGFGSAVAVSHDATRVVVGANGRGHKRGAAYVFARSGAAWTQEARLEPDDGRLGDYYGFSVAVSGDGLTVAAGSVNHDDEGAAYAYDRGDGGAWTPAGELAASGTADGNERFGGSLELSHNGTVLLAAAPNRNWTRGAAFVFSRASRGAAWALDASLVDAGSQPGDRLAAAVALSRDGDVALLGAPLATGNASGHSGVALVFARAPGAGGAWALERRLEPGSNVDDAGSFGHSVALGGRTALVGAPHARAGGRNFSHGVVHVYDAWAELAAPLDMGDGINYTEAFGRAVAVSRDGRTAAVGVPGLDSWSGAAFAFAAPALPCPAEAGRPETAPGARVPAECPDDAPWAGPASRLCAADAYGSGEWEAADDTQACSAEPVCGDGKTAVLAGEACDVVPADPAVCDPVTCQLAAGISCVLDEPGRRGTCHATGDDDDDDDDAEVDVDFGAAAPENGRRFAAWRPRGRGEVRLLVPPRLLPDGKKLRARPDTPATSAPPAPPARAYRTAYAPFRVAEDADATPDFSEPMQFDVQLESPCEATSALHLYDLEAGGWRSAAATCEGERRREVLDAGTCVLSTNVCHLTDFSVLSCTGDQPTELDVTPGGGTGVDASGNLRLVLRSDASRYAAAPEMRFAGARTPAECSSALGAAAWAVADEGTCVRRHTFDMPLAEALRQCGFEGPAETADGDAYEYTASVESTGVAAGGSVFGAGVTRTETVAFEVRVRVPRRAAATAGGEAFGAAITLAQASTQRANAETGDFSWTVAASVQAPYYLAATGASATDGPGGAPYFSSVAPAGAPAPGDCDGLGAGAACTQSFGVDAAALPGVCELDTAVRLEFEVRCRPGFAGSCDLPSPAASFVTFRVRASGLCATVAEVASVAPSLGTFASGDARGAGGAGAADFVQGTTVYGRVHLDVEGGVRVDSVELLDLAIVSQCGDGCARGTVRPVTDGAVDAGAAAAYAFEHASGAAGEPHHDFEFLVNDASVQFSDGAGQVVVTLDATVRVLYTSASGQRAERVRRVRAAAAAPARSAPVSAQLTLAARAAVGGGGDDGGRTGGSGGGGGGSAIGLGSGALAAVGIAVVALVAAAAVVGARRRRSRRRAGGRKPGPAVHEMTSAEAAAASSSSSSSSAVSLYGSTEDVEFVREGAAVPGFAGAESVADVHAAYGELDAAA